MLHNICALGLTDLDLHTYISYVGFLQVVSERHAVLEYIHPDDARLRDHFRVFRVLNVSPILLEQLTLRVHYSLRPPPAIVHVNLKPAPVARPFSLFSRLIVQCRAYPRTLRLAYQFSTLTRLLRHVSIPHTRPWVLSRLTTLHRI